MCEVPGESHVWHVPGPRRARPEQRGGKMWVELVKHCHHQDRSETPKWKDHSGRDTPRGEAPVEGNNGQ